MIDSLELARELRNHIVDAADNAPRSQQKKIGPSEVGTPCVRRIGYRLLEVDAVNKPDSWMATIGTAVHSWLADVYQGKSERYLVEQRVDVTDELSGSVDLYDKERKLVIDWKVVGETSLNRYKRSGPGEQYRTQVHLYGLGLKNKGHDVENVGIAFLPRGNSLRGMYLWTEPFDAGVAKAGLDRLELAKQVVNNGGKESLQLLPATSSNCDWCPFYLPASTNLATGCPGAIQPNPTH